MKQIRPKSSLSKQSKPVSSVIYQGPSLIDGKPIVCIAIIKSGNIKTGNAIQTHIIRADISPMDASKTGEDYSICGDCIHRGTPTDNPNKKQAVNRSCYVTLYQGPTVVYKTFKRGAYPIASVEDIKAIGKGRMVRLGSYGDPSAVPQNVWDALLTDSVGHTGYTHQHNAKTDYSRLMHSADSKEQAEQAHSTGKRTFRVIPVKVWENQGKASLLQSEILCPASNEAGNKVTCIDCKLCVGSSIKAKSIAIVSHGTGRNMLNVKGDNATV
jgi:hypothetical protein